MKLIVVAFLAGVFKSDCGHFNNESTNQVSTFKEHFFPAGPEKTKFTDEVDESEQNEIYRRGKGGKRIQGILQTLKRKLGFLENNLTQSNMKIEKDVELIKYNLTHISDTEKNTKKELLNKMGNITDGDKQLITEVNSMKSNMNTYNSNIVSKLNSVDTKLISHNSNAISKLNSVDTKLISHNSNTISKMNSIDSKLTSHISNTVSKLNSIDSKLNSIGVKRDIYCPDTKVDAGQDLVCARRKGINYQTGLNYCKSLGLNLAQPKNLLNVCSKVLATAGGTWYWIGGKGTGSYQRWNNGTYLSSSLSVWQAGYPKTSTSDCLILWCSDSYIKTGKVLRTYPCSSTSGFLLCA